MSKVRLGDIADIELGKMLDAEKNTGDLHPYLANVNVRWGSFDLDGLPLMRFEDDEAERFLLRPGDLVMCEGGEPGRCAIWRGEVSDARYQKALHRIRPHENVDVRWLYYWFLLQGRIGGLNQYINQTTIKHLVREDLKNVQIDLPTLDVQRRIAAVLSAIDDKIENNRKLMAELEATARLAYDEWFVRFDFPDEQGHPYRSSGGKMVWNDELKREIPTGWKIVTVGDLITVTKGISYTSADLEGAGIPMVNLATFSTDGTIKPDGIKSFSGTPDPRRLVRPGDLLMCVTQQTAIDLTGKTNVIGKTFLMPAMYEGDVVISTDVAKLSVAHSELLAYFDQLFRIPEIHKHIAGYANGTKIKHLDVEGALDFQVPLPEHPMLLERFADLVRHMTGLKGIVLHENESLSSLRDWLLPMLMNGQITVGE